jgi:hypothetical protein
VSPAANGQSPFLSSVPEGKATAEVVPLSFKDAIDRALRNNLGLLLGSDNLLTHADKNGRNSPICCRMSVVRRPRAQRKLIWQRWAFDLTFRAFRTL